MAIKKKAAKPAKKASAKPAAKTGKQVAAKKPAPKKSAPSKAGAKGAAKKDAKPVQKKVSKPVPVKNAKTVKAPSKPVAKKAAPAPAAKPAQQQAPTQSPAINKIAAAPAEKPAAQPVATPPVKSLVSTPPPPRPAARKEPAKPVKVVIPEIKTKSSVKYQPEFTKSVLDTPQHNTQTGPTMRYSDVELAEFKEIILKKLEAAKKELAYLQGLITRKDEMGGDESENRYMTMEDGSMSMEREQLSQMASRQITFIDHLEKALMRIENKTYGICRVTGKLIDKARLRAVPHATLSIEAKQTMNK